MLVSLIISLSLPQLQLLSTETFEDNLLGTSQKISPQS